MIKTRIILCLLPCSLLLACGGPTKTSAAGNKQLADEAGLPPEGEAIKLDREVSRDSLKDFAAAVAYYNEQEKKGWTESGCREASEKFQDVANSAAKMIEARYNSGLALQNCGMNKAAEAEYKKALKISVHAQSLSNLGEIYFHGGNETAAKQYWERAVEADKQIAVAAARNNLAWLMIRDIRDGKGSVKSLEPKVKEMLSSALAVDNDNVEAYTIYGLLYMEDSDKNKSRLTLAKLLLDKGEEINPNFAPLHNAKGLLLLRQDNVPRALVSFRRAIQLDPNMMEAHRNLGNIVLGFRKYNEAKDAFEAVLKLAPKDYDAQIGLGYALRGLKDFDGAEAAYKAAKKDGPNRAEADYNLGILYQDFRSNESEDLKVPLAAYKTAITYFKQASSKPTASAKMKKDAAQNIKQCEKNIKNLEQAIEFQKQMNNNP